MSSLDLRINGKLSIENAKKITLIQKQIQGEYTEFIANLIHLNQLDELALLLRVTTRNTYASIIYDSMCRLALLEDLLKSQTNISSIYIDRPSIKKPIIELLAKYEKEIKVEISDYKKTNQFIVIINLIKNFYISFNFWLMAKLVRNKDHSNKGIFLLDTFLFKNSLNKNSDYEDRYYPGLVDNLPEEISQKTWFLPTLSGFKHPLELYKILSSIKKSKTHFLVKENWLNLNDYIFAIKKSISLTKLIKVSPKWRDLDLFDIVSEDNETQRGSHSISEPILTYLSFNRYRLAGIKILGVIDWFENQVVDHGLYLGMRRNFPETIIKGYIGFVPEEYYIGIYPAEYEFKAKILPDELLVIGEIFVEKMKRFKSDMKVTNAPAFRYKKVLEYQDKKIFARDIVIIALPMKFDEAKKIIKLALETGFNKNYRWFIKIHPVTKFEKIINLIPKSQRTNVKFINEPLVNFFQETRLLITSASSVAVDAAVCGVRVAIIGNDSGPTINRLAGIIDENLWAVCFNSLELENQVILDKNINQIDKNEYFNPVTSKEIINMMKFEK
tara:strand:- start:1795 stop:3465 length:1671 start_codon:yes stop_codon:yes gene_type:complete